MFRARDIHVATALAAALVGAPSPLLAEPAAEIGERLSLRSALLGEERTLLVHLPESYEGSTFRYPVLFLLDGEAEFLHTVGIVDFLASTGQMPETILVGVVNTVRSRDLTPPSGDEEETAFWPAVGEADTFRAFFADELIPFIDDRYRTEPYRIVRGQSFGGLFAIHDYMSDAPTFDAYLTSSPAVGWNFGELIRRAPHVFDEPLRRPLAIAASGRDFPGSLESIQRFVEVLETHRGGDPAWRYQFHPEEDHYSLVHQATYRALRYLYAPWPVPDEVVEGARFEDYEDHYEELSRRYGYPIEIPMRTVIRLGNQLLRAQRFDDGLRVLSQNLERYPEQPESHWHVGDAHVLAGQPERARPHFEAALRLARARRVPDVADYQRSLDELDASPALTPR